jgi:hypothetical protein
VSLGYGWGQASVHWRLGLGIRVPVGMRLAAVCTTAAATGLALETPVRVVEHARSRPVEGLLFGPMRVAGSLTWPLLEVVTHHSLCEVLLLLSLEVGV